MSFPPGTEMFQFPGFASPKLCIHFRDNRPTKPRLTANGETRFNGEAGLPHSEIVGSKVAHTSPTLIAACHVLHRLCMPRHPPNALTSHLRAHTINASANAQSSTCRINLSLILLNTKENSRFPMRPKIRHRFQKPIHNVKEARSFETATGRAGSGFTSS